MKTQAPPVRVVLATRLGSITLAVDVAKAPASASAFLAYLDQGRFASEGTFWRVVRAQDNDSGDPDVIQGGLSDSSLPGVVHESTAVTGLTHLDGTVSLARASLAVPPARQRQGAESIHQRDSCRKRGQRCCADKLGF
jgi:peptidyl-prolyl cis-trans isomerase A (cyclophilin A)